MKYLYQCKNNSNTFSPDCCESKRAWQWVQCWKELRCTVTTGIPTPHQASHLNTSSKPVWTHSELPWARYRIPTELLCNNSTSMSLPRTRALMSLIFYLNVKQHKWMTARMIRLILESKTHDRYTVWETHMSTNTAANQSNTVTLDARFTMLTSWVM